MALSKIDVANMLTGATPVANGGTALTSGTSGQFLKFTGSTTLASAADNQGGITEADTWRITSNFTGNTSPITANWERDDAYQNINMGTGMTQSSGVFSFPSTGVYQVSLNLQFISGGTDNDYILGNIEFTTNNSAYNTTALAYASIKNNSTYQMLSCKKIFNITDLTNQKVRFNTSSQDNNHTVATNTNQNFSYAMFIKLGDV